MAFDMVDQDDIKGAINLLSKVQRNTLMIYLF